MTATQIITTPENKMIAAKLQTILTHYRNLMWDRVTSKYAIGETIPDSETFTATENVYLSITNIIGELIDDIEDNDITAALLHVNTLFAKSSTFHKSTTLLQILRTGKAAIIDILVTNITEVLSLQEVYNMLVSIMEQTSVVIVDANVSVTLIHILTMLTKTTKHRDGTVSHQFDKKADRETFLLHLLTSIAAYDRDAAKGLTTSVVARAKMIRDTYTFVLTLLTQKVSTDLIMTLNAITLAHIS